MTKLLIWEGTKEDARAAAAVEEQAFGEKSWGAASFLKTVSSPGVRLLLAGRSQTAPHGFALWLPAGDAADLLSLGVAPAAQRQGTGRALIRALSVAAREACAQRLLLDVAHDNHAAVALYCACGFREIARRKTYYKSGADALILEKRLTTPD